MSTFFVGILPNTVVYTGSADILFGAAAPRLCVNSRRMGNQLRSFPIPLELHLSSLLGAGGAPRALKKDSRWSVSASRLHSAHNEDTAEPPPVGFADTLPQGRAKRLPLGEAVIAQAMTDEGRVERCLTVTSLPARIFF